MPAPVLLPVVVTLVVEAVVMGVGVEVVAGGLVVMGLGMEATFAGTSVGRVVVLAGGVLVAVVVREVMMVRRSEPSPYFASTYP